MTRRPHTPLAAVALGLLLTLPCPAADAGEVPERLDLATCLRRAAQQNPSVLVARTRIREARAGVQAARADSIPDIELVDSHLRTNRTFPSFFNRPDYNHQITATLSQRLYSGGAIPAGVRVARGGQEEAEAGYQAALEEVLERVTVAYLGVLREQEALEVVEESIATNQRRIQDIQAKVDAGIMLETDRLQADLQLLTDERAQLVARTSRELHRDTLAVLLGLPGGTDVDLTGQLEPLSTLDPDAVRSDVSLQGSPVLARQRARIEQAQARLDVARAAFKPKVDVQITQYHIANGLSVFSRDANYMEAMGAVTVPVFDGGRRRGELHQAERLLDAARLESRSQRDELTIQVGQAVLRIEEAQAQLETAATRIRLAARSRQITQERYLQGSAIRSELLDADVAYRRAQLDEIVARFSILEGVTRVLEITGRLTGTVLADADLSGDPVLAARIHRIADQETR